MLAAPPPLRALTPPQAAVAWQQRTVAGTALRLRAQLLGQAAAGVLVTRARGSRRRVESAASRHTAAAAMAAAKRGATLSRSAASDVRIDKVLFLGTSSAVPVPGKRNMSSLAVLLSSGAAVLVDCGEGTQHHIRVSSMLRASRIETILITHLHGDHCFGLFGLLHSMAMEGRREPVLLVGPQGLRSMVETVLRCSGGWFPEDSFELRFLEIPNCGVEGGEDLVGPDGFGPQKEGFSPERCARASPVPLGVHSGLVLQAVPMVHSVPDWGYLLREPDRAGALDAAKAIELGVPAKSPLLGRLKRGQPVQLSDGSTVRPEQVLGPPVVGRTLAVLQDTCDSTSAARACAGAACVVHEATFEGSMAREAWEKGHSTSTMAARFAASCAAKRLVLTHFSARYSTSDANASSENEDPAEKLGEEARQVLGPDTPVVIAKDFLVLRGDRDFEPEAKLAVKLLPWGRPAACPPSGGGDAEMAPCPGCG